MDSTKLIDYIPAILILLSVMIVTIIILMKYGNRVFDKEYKAANILLFVTAFLFVTILIVHLFNAQTWTEDTLKILIGVLVGAGSTKFSEKNNNGESSVDISDSSIGGDLAGRDINKNIQNINEAISKIENSIVNQHNQIKQIVTDNSDFDILINTIYERGNSITAPIERVVQYWHNEGWILKHFSSDYHGMDGIFLVFTRKMEGDSAKTFYYHGSDIARFNVLD
jgi:hypothetical protein